MIRTPNQQRDTCPGNQDVSPCNNTYNPCPNMTGLYDPMSQGIYTGKCCSDTIQPFQCNSSHHLQQAKKYYSIPPEARREPSAEP